MDEAATEVRKLRRLLIFVLVLIPVLFVGWLWFEQEQEDGKREAEEYVDCIGEEIATGADLGCEP